ncbi:Ig-like domain-containing protein [Streptomyces sp. NPDC046977]|uniref:L,D-transpeptidase n=1 Tax=Streptomyces sp. NPDC046977 TaxID=3154703 RepID=UPI0033E1226D
MHSDRIPRASAAVLALSVAASLSACSGSGDAGGTKGAAARPAITVTPASGGQPVPVDRKVTVRVTSGRLDSVRVTAPGPGALSGALASGKDGWTSTGHLAPGVTYDVVARATGDDGKALTRHVRFTTAEADRTFVGEYHPDKGTTVGVGMPVSIVFNRPIRDRAAVERKLAVTASPAVDGSWSWMKDWSGRDRVDWRPRAFWKAGTDVTLRMNLDGVDAGGGVYGTQNRVVRFRIGHAVTTTVDTSRKTLTLSRDGKVVRTLPVSAGKPGYETWNGTMVVLEKTPSITMNSRTVRIFGPEAYNLKDVKWDVRLTTSGTFTHAAPWNDGKFGKVNGSHGCVGMSTADAKWFYEQVGIGDPVTVVHSTDTVQLNNGYGAWNADWDDWSAGSAL